MIRRTAVALVAGFVLALPGAADALMDLRPGDAPPAFTLPDLAGRSVGSRELAGPAAAVLFWSTWSPRSAEMLDDFKRHAAAYGPRGLTIVAINVDGENLGPSQQAAVRAYAQA